MTKNVPITVAKGDGIGPEIMDATLRILEAAGARIQPEFVVLGEEAFKKGIMNGVTDEAWGSINCTGVILKAPLTTPQGGGYKSVNVTLRKSLGLYANVRPTVTYSPVVPSRFEGIDVVIVRENEEDLYAGMEYTYTSDVTTALKMITRKGSQKIIRYAFEYAVANGRKKVTAMVKDNIMKITDGLFHKVFQEIGAEYPQIEKDSIIVDIGMARVADTPENFDVIVTENLYGDIVSDIASQIAGSVGLAGSVNMGEKCAMFEAIHGSAPDITGQGIANPSGLLNGALLMLHHIGQSDVAVTVENAWLATLEQGKVTSDIAGDLNVKALSTSEFADAVIANVGNKPTKLKAKDIKDFKKIDLSKVGQEPVVKQERQLVGADVFVEWQGGVAQLGEKLNDLAAGGLALDGVASRGVKVFPREQVVDVDGEVWCVRFMGDAVSNEMIRNLLANAQQAGLTWLKVENLYHFDGERGYAVFQGE